MDEMIAHVCKDEEGQWRPPHTLIEHSLGTARLSELFSSRFHSGEWGKVLGLCHDIGKGRPQWQDYLKRKSGYYDEEAHLEGKDGKMPHAIFGASLAEKLFGKGFGRILAYAIAGHHAGLQDWDNREGAGQKSLKYQLGLINGLDWIPQTLIRKMDVNPPKSLPWRFNRGLDASLWIRMLYSCLVDADFLNTEEYMKPESSQYRGRYCSMKELNLRFTKYMEQKESSSAGTRVNEIRRYIRTKCEQSASEEQGIFSMSVPTGGGKTLSSLAFALRHAIVHSLERIIYVIPYTSIIEQNSEVFREAIGADQVVEHHSNVIEDELTPQSRLASENWDAPVIVTTSVQFFESLFASKSSKCRKLHNISNSVVILDEAQLVPPRYLAPILESIQLLVEHYGVSFVISTATKPAFDIDAINGTKFCGLKKIKEIIGSQEEVKSLYESLKRVKTEIPADLNKINTWEEISSQLKENRQVLCIVSDRKSCRELHSLMPKGTFHLSALMCGQHRSDVINLIKQKLAKDEEVRVISTQLVEAGVDLDFPVVYRSFAGLDSISQAAGRCNREGKLDNMGRVVVFVSPRNPPKGVLRKAADATRGILSLKPEDPLEFCLFNPFFKDLYQKVNSLDEKDIIPLLNPDSDFGMCFKTAAEQFKIIDDSMQKTILVPYREGESMIAQLKTKGPERWLMRKLQRFSVNVYNEEFDLLVKKGSVEEIYPGIYALTFGLDYTEETGLLVQETSYDPENFIM